MDAILEVEHVPPHDVMPSQEALDRVREIAAEAYRRHEEIAAEEVGAQGPGLSLNLHEQALSAAGRSTPRSPMSRSAPNTLVRVDLEEHPRFPAPL